MIAQDEEGRRNSDQLVQGLQSPGSQHVQIQDVSSFDCHYYRFCHNNYGYKLLITVRCYQLSFNELNRCN